MAVQTSETAAPPRGGLIAWVPWVGVALMTAAVTLTFVITDNSATSREPTYPAHQLYDPVVPWIFQYAYPVVWFALLVLIAIQTYRTRRFSIPAILFLAGTTMFWIEWPADWGSYLVYNKDFSQFSGWTSTWYQTYWKPVNVIFGYGVFFGVESLLLVYVVPKVKAALKRLLPKASDTVLLVITCLGVFYAADILGERLMTVAGWYSYVEPVGLAWTSARGSISFVWPAIPFLLFAVAITLALRQDEQGHYPNEKFFRLHQLGPGWAREFARLAVWILTMNVAIFIAQPVILVIGRILFLHDSVYVP